MAALKPVHLDALTTGSRRILESLGRASWRDDHYLAGSAGLALYLAHRPVRDLDFMTSGNRLRSAERRDLLEALLAIHTGTTVETARDGFLSVRIDTIGVRFFYYPYPVIDPLEEISGVWVASLLDLALMKLGAVISRGGRRDFIDLYLLCRELPLADILDRSPDKFGHVHDFPLQALKGLADLSPARDEPSPTLIEPLDWADVENWIGTDVRSLARRWVGLPEDGGTA